MSLPGPRSHPAFGVRATALKFLGPQAGAAGTVPWQRVLGSAGTISSRGPGTSGAERQRQALEAEGVVVTVGRTGDLRVDLTIYGWFPEVGTIDLPQSQVGGELDAHDQEHSNGEEID